MTPLPGRLPESPSQTAGPYLQIGLAPARAGLTVHPPELGLDIAGPQAPGRRIRVEGVIRDGTGAPVRDALIEVWQADTEGRHPHPLDPRAAEVAPGFRGWGRVVPDAATGLWAFDTVKPGRIRDPRAGLMAPHLSLWIVARGINLGLATRVYFDDEEAANAEDPVLGLVEPARRGTLLARRQPDAGLPALYRFDIRLQGEGETVFLDA
jgi:protocatechuate 3,4-dioxygenase alpha subunit